MKFQKLKLWLFDFPFQLLKFQLCNCITLTNYDYQTVQLESLSKGKGRRGREGKARKGDRQGGGRREREGKMGGMSEGEERNIDWRKDVYG